MLGWHFLQNNRKMQWNAKGVVKAGKIYTCKGEIEICKNGMHGSKRIIDALQYASGAIVCRVNITGELIHNKDKFVGRNRKVLWMFDANDILHEFACRCAEDALSLIDKPDPRSIVAIKAKRDWLVGKISNKELSTATDAAWAATTDASTAAAWSARDAAKVATNASVNGASLAAKTASSNSAWFIATDAITAVTTTAGWLANDAIRDAALASIWSTKNRRLTSMVVAARR